MELLFKKEVLGEIKDLIREDFWVHGKVIPSELFQKYKQYFDLLISEENNIDEYLYENDFFNDTNWFIKENNQLKEISIPAIYPDGEISFRYRI